MCILLIAYRCHPRYDLIVAANRDEFYARDSAAAAYWPNTPILAGRDLSAGGTWLGVTSDGFFAAVTNLRGAGLGTISRGHLVRDFLISRPTPATYLAQVSARASAIAGCNLLIADRAQLHWWSHQAQQCLSPGIYGVSNSLLLDEWPKVARLKAAYAAIAQRAELALVDGLFDILRDAPTTPPADLMAVEFQRLEEKIFVQTPSYGTRCSTVVLRDAQHLYFAERRFDEQGHRAGEDTFVQPLTRDAAVHH